AIGVDHGVTHQGVHRDAAQPGAVLCHRLIRRALVDADVVVDVNGQLAAPDVAGVCVFNAHRPILNVVDPTLTEGACVNHAAVVDQKPLVVVCVQQPAHLQLFDI